MAVHTTDGSNGSVDLSNEVQIKYEARFLKRAKHLLVHEDGAQKGSVGEGEGNVVRFNRYTPLSAATTPLSEGVNPAEASLTSSTVDASLNEYGTTIKVSRFLSLTSIDKKDMEKMDVVGQNMGETLDQLARDALYSGATALLANGKSALTDVAATDVYDYQEVKKQVRYLEAQKAMRYSDGFFKGVVGPYTKFDLTASSEWVNAKTYSDTKDLYRGEIGELGGVRFALTTNQKTESSTTTVYSNFVHGENAFGTHDLAGDIPRLYIVPNTKIDSGNAAGRFGLISWAGSYVAKVLIATWISNAKTGATA